MLAVFFVPAFYVAVQSLIELINGPPKPVPKEGEGEVVTTPHEPGTPPLAQRVDHTPLPDLATRPA